MRLDDRITFQEPSDSTDQYGETTTTYSDGDEFWAAADVGSPSELREGSAPEESASVTLTVRTEVVDRLGLSREDRLKYDGDILRVDGRRDADRDGFADVFTTRVR
jgi:head-tail adaptor